MIINVSSIETWIICIYIPTEILFTSNLWPCTSIRCREANAVKLKFGLFALIDFVLLLFHHRALFSTVVKIVE